MANKKKISVQTFLYDEYETREAFDTGVKAHLQGLFDSDEYTKIDLIPIGEGITVIANRADVEKTTEKKQPKLRHDKDASKDLVDLISEVGVSGKKLQAVIAEGYIVRYNK